MNTTREQLLFDLLNRALGEEMGVVVTTNNPHQMTMKLHAAKKADPKYAELEITIPSTEETVIICRKSVELDEPVNGDLPDD